MYFYQAESTDFENHPRWWSFDDDAPAGMKVGEFTGLVEWWPSADEAGESVTATLRVTDYLGGTSTQELHLYVSGVNQPPTVILNPPATAIVGQRYEFQIEADDPEKHEIVYQITSPEALPAGMSIDEDGLFVWESPQSPDGTYPYLLQDIAIEVTDIYGAGFLNTFDITVLESEWNEAPIIEPIITAEECFVLPGATFDYTFRVTDPDGDEVTIELPVKPDGMTWSYDEVEDEYHIRWTPTAEQTPAAGTFPYPMHDAVLVVRDDGAFQLGASVNFYVMVISPTDGPVPVIEPIADQFAVSGTGFTLSVSAEPAHALDYPLEFELVAQAGYSLPPGLTIDEESGRITWASTVSGTYPLEVVVRDRWGRENQEDFSLVVAEDYANPTVAIDFEPDVAAPGEWVTVRIVASDDTSIATRWLYLGDTSGTPLPLDATYACNYQVPQMQELPVLFTAVATDLAGKQTEVQAGLNIVLPDAEAPQVFLDLADGAVITTPRAIFGSVIDADLQSWTLSLTSELSGTVMVLSPQEGSQNTAEVINGQLARLDPTLLENGRYVLELVATDGVHTSSCVRQVNIDGKLKMGNLSLSFSDLVVPGLGLPITVTRTYDSLRADVAGDFGYGWRLGLGQTHLTTLPAGGSMPGFGGVMPMREGSRVVVTLADGTTAGFTFQPVLRTASIGESTYVPYFMADADVKSMLYVPDAEDVILKRFTDASGHHEYYLPDGSYSYNPQHSRFGNRYWLVTATGETLTLNATTGSTISTADRNGNKLTYNYAGGELQSISSSSGRSVTFVWSQGRISEVIAPDDTPGNPDDNLRIVYGYDAAGDLVTVTRRWGATERVTSFCYNADPEHGYPRDYPHWLTDIIDPRGLTVLSLEIGPDGRIENVADASDASIAFSFTLDLGDGRFVEKSEASGGVTEFVRDGDGNVLRQIEWLNTAATGEPAVYEYLVTVYRYDAEGNPTWESVPFTVTAAQVEPFDPTDATHRYNQEPAAWQSQSTYVDGRPMRVTDGLGHTTTYSYDTYGNVKTVTDALGNTTENEYDSRGNLIWMKDGEGTVTLLDYVPDRPGLVESIRDGAGSVLSSFTYDAYGNVSSSTGASGVTQYFVYDALGNQTLSYRYWTNPADPNETRTLVSRSDYEDARVVATWQYEVAGQQVYTSASQLDGVAEVWKTATYYDPAGLVGWSTDQFDVATENVYDSRGQLVERRTQAKDENGEACWLVTRTWYDALGRAVFATDQYSTGDGVNPPADVPPAVFGTHTVYDSLGRVIRTERVAGLVIALDGIEALEPSGYQVLSASQTHYDQTGRVDYTLDRFGARSRYTYDAVGRQIESRTQARDETGALVWLVTRSVYDAAGRPMASADAYVIAYEEDGQGHPLASPGASPAVLGTISHYDRAGRVVKSERLEEVVVEIVATGGGLESRLLSVGGTVWISETVYDTNGRVARSIGRHTLGEDGPATDYEYDDAGRQTATIGPAVLDELSGELVRHRTESKYGTEGRLQENWVNIRVIVDADGNVLSTSYADKQVTRFEYDAYGRTTKTIYGVGTAIESYVAQGYDDYGRVMWESEQAYSSEQNPLKREFEYDDFGRLRAVVLPEVAHPTLMDESGPEPVPLMVHPRYEYRYDAQGNHVSIRDNVYQTVAGIFYDHDGTAGDFSQAFDTRVTELTYDAQGRQTSRTLPIGVATTGDPDDFVERKFYNDRSLAAAVGDGESLAESVALGQLEYEVSFEGVVTAYRYDNSARAGGRLVAKYYYGGATAEADYPADAEDGSLTAADEAVRYGYDAFGRQVEVIQDGDGNLTTTADQRVATKAYDSLGNLVTIANDIDGDGTVDTRIHYEFDPVTGNLLRTYTGDADDAHTSTSSDGKAITDTRYGYDVLGRLVSVTVVERNDTPLTTPEVTEYRYDLLGNLDKVRLPNEVVSDYRYNLNRLVQLKTFHDDYASGTDWVFDEANENLLAQFDYDLLADGKRSGVTEIDDADQTTRIDWFYDQLGRLTREVYDSFNDDLDFAADYVLDLVGNRLGKNVDSDPTAQQMADYRSGAAMSSQNVDEAITSTFDANDRLLTEAKDVAGGTTEDRFTRYEYGPGATTSFGGNGTQQTKKTVREGMNDSGNKVEEDSYTYNLQGRMSQVDVDSNGDGTTDTTTDYQYADDGVRVSETVNGTKTLFVVDRHNATGYSQVLEEKDASGNVLKTYTLGLDIISQQAPAIQNGATLYLLKDGHGSTRGLVDAIGLPLSGQIYAYDALGNPIGFNPLAALTNRLYNSEPFLGSIKLYDFRDRLYDPRLGRFPTVDRFFGDLNNPITFNKYVFVHGDGINFNDPLGMSEFSLSGMLAGIGIGYTVGYLDAYIAGKSTGECVVQGLWGAAFGGVLGGFGVPAFAALAKTSLVTQASVLSVLTALIAWQTQIGVDDAIAQGNPNLTTYRYTVGYLSAVMLPFGLRAAARPGPLIRPLNGSRAAVLDLSSVESLASEAEIAAFEASLDSQAALPAIEGALDTPRTPAHMFSQQFLAELFRITPGAKRVGMGVRLSKFSGQSHTPDIEPDAMVLRENGTIDMAEVLSPGQTVKQVYAKLETAWYQLAPQKRGQIYVVEPGKPGAQ